MSSTVCVTGASGYIASNLIEQLIKEGYKVRGTVRSLSNEERISHLRSQFSGDLELFEADLLKPESFDKAIEGCSAVFHTASPFQLQVEDPIKDLVEPAVQGTLNVLNSAKKANVLRVILTSSVAAIVGDKQPEDPNYAYSEKDWNQDSRPTDSVSGYRFSKKVAEEEAWNFAKENGLQLTVINPSFVLGPPLSTRTDSTSIKTVIALLSGFFLGGVPPARYGCIDVRDVANAHVQALKRPESIGSRFMVTSARSYTQLELSEIIRDILTNDITEAQSLIENLPTTYAAPPKWESFHDITKLTTVLEITPKPIRDSLKDMIRFLLDAGIV